MTLSKSKLLPIPSSIYFVNATGSPPFWPRLSKGYFLCPKKSNALAIPHPKNPNYWQYPHQGI
jgi:hypothetical protein